eukprot:scaffold6230_cov151-Skeletonema_menzelii.AAC.22
MDPKYATVKTARSGASILNKCSCGPFNIPKLAMKVMLPHVKLNANFCGRTVNSGIPTKNASKKNKADSRRQTQNT